ncbi:hypothetical protein LTR85_002775 [Meristemomyces frigidus]|nr:hypothetical protein LTR85_002775 [Meristemomyces frigidus]
MVGTADQERRVLLDHHQEEPRIYRFNSYSTGRSTLIGSDNGLGSPVSPLPNIDQKFALGFPIQTGSHNKQWIDLDLISPKLLRELRRQYESSAQDEPSHPLAKGAAKVKAWARQSKLGIDIRLRRKINAEHDEVTDIRLVPEPAPGYDVKLPLMAELPGALNEISELPDSSLPQELPTTSTREPPRSSTGSSTAEPLPLYEPPKNSPPTCITGMVVAEPQERDSHQGLHRRSSSESSIVATPKRGLSLDREHAIRSSNTEEKGWVDPTTQEDVHAAPEVQALKADLVQANDQLDYERRTRERFEGLLQDVRDELVKQRGDKRSGETPESSKAFLGGLKVAETARYETETDVEPPSPNERRSRPAARGKKAPVYSFAKRGKSGAKTKPAKPPVGAPYNDRTPPQDDYPTGLVERQPTLPKRTPASAGVEELWAALLRSQATLVGPEHPLTYQAKSDLARSRATQHTAGRVGTLAALEESKILASHLLGDGHPLVASFSADLKTLEGSLGIKPAEEAVVSHALVKKPGPSVAVTAPPPASLPAPEQPVNADNTDRKQNLPLITTTFHPTKAEDLPATQTARLSSSGDPWTTWRPPHQPRSALVILCSLVFAAVTKVSLNSILWLQRNYGPEQAVEPGKVRVRWTCTCGQQMHDDFIERRPGAAREMEAYLNRPRMHAGGTPTSPSSSQGSRSFTNSSFGSTPSPQSSWSSYGFTQGSPLRGDGTKPPGTSTGLPFYMPSSALPDPPWLLTCANEDRYTPKLAHLDMAPHNIRSDKDLATSLRNHYFNVNKKWWRVLKLRGLTTIEFVQFEVHQNRFADIRKSPDVPPGATSDYSFEPGDLLPPVGSQYLLHLFKHPEDYDDELITYLRAPKKNGRLTLGRGWGISLVEGFEAAKVWLMVSTFFAVGSLVFAIAWAYIRHDVQGAFGVAAWVCDMGVGIARLLIANNYRVITNASDRSKETQDRARKNSVDLVPTDVELCNTADYILSIVPPRDALRTAQRIITASSNPAFNKRSNPLYYLDLNAISPRSAREINDLFAKSSPDVRLIDGGIIGSPPKLKDDGTWYKPSVPVSGPHKLSEAQPSGAHLAAVLNMQHINDTIGSATGLKMCFAALSKGFTALAIQSLTSAHNLGCLPELKQHLQLFNPGAAKSAESVTRMPPKAYRWVREMEEIAETFEADGGFEGDESIFRPVAKVYDLVAYGTELGSEKTEDRKRGKTTEDVALLMSEGTAKRKEKTE